MPPTDNPSDRSYGRSVNTPLYERVRQAHQDKDHTVLSEKFVNAMCILASLGKFSDADLGAVNFLHREGYISERDYNRLDSAWRTAQVLDPEF